MDPDGKRARVQITEDLVRQWARSARGKFFSDREVRGFNVRVTPAGVVSFALTYRIHRRQRRFSIGQWPEWSVREARDRAGELRRAVREGHDPLAERALDRSAPLMLDLAARYLSDYAERNNRPSSLRNNRQMLEGIILPRFGRHPVAAITRDDLERLHHSLRGTPYRANRVRALLSVIFRLAIQWKMRSDNPALGLPPYPEERRDRWLRDDELKRLMAALGKYPNRSVADAIRLLILTGARKNEVLCADWLQFDLERSTWTKPSAHTKQKRIEHVPLNQPAVQLLNRMRRSAKGTYLFPGRVDGHPLEDVKSAWKEICEKAKLDGIRIHDLRHTYASHLVSAGVPLQVVGKLLGHTQSQTTERYAHFADAVLRRATNLFGKKIEMNRTHIDSASTKRK